MAETIGFIGLGAMGGGMAGNLLQGRLCARRQRYRQCQGGGLRRARRQSRGDADRGRAPVGAHRQDRRDDGPDRGGDPGRKRHHRGRGARPRGRDDEHHRPQRRKARPRPLGGRRHRHAGCPGQRRQRAGGSGELSVIAGGDEARLRGLSADVQGHVDEPVPRRRHRPGAGPEARQQHADPGQHGGHRRGVRDGRQGRPRSEGDVRRDQGLDRGERRARPSARRA